MNNPYRHGGSGSGRQSTLLVLLLAIGSFLYVVYDNAAPSQGQLARSHLQHAQGSRDSLRALRADLMRKESSLKAVEAELAEATTSSYAHHQHAAASVRGQKQQQQQQQQLRAEIAALKQAAQRSAAQAQALRSELQSAKLGRQVAQSKIAELASQLERLSDHEAGMRGEIEAAKAAMRRHAAAAAAVAAAAAAAEGAGIAALDTGDSAVPPPPSSSSSSSSSSSAVDAPAPPRDGLTSKFLLWDLDPPNYGERLSTRKRYAVRSFFLVRQLAAAAAAAKDGTRWILVLPPFPASFDGSKNYIRWDAIFDVERLRRAYPHLMEFEDWAAGAAEAQGGSGAVHSTREAPSPRPLDMLVPLQDKIGSFASADADKPFAWQKCEQQSLAYGITKEAGGAATIFGKKVSVHGCRCAPTGDARKAATEAMKAREARSVMLTRFFCPGIPGDDWEIWKHMRSSALVLREVRRASCARGRALRSGVSLPLCARQRILLTTLVRRPSARRAHSPVVPPPPPAGCARASKIVATPLHRCTSAQK